MRFWHTIILAAAVVASVPRPAIAQENPRAIAMLGAYTVGSKLAEVRHLIRSENNCFGTSKLDADCQIMDRRSGVHYILFERDVVNVKAHVSTAKVALPLGLKFGESISSADQRLSRSEGKWERTNVQGGVQLSSTREYAGKNGWSFHVNLTFVADRLTQVEYFTHYI